MGGKGIPGGKVTVGAKILNTLKSPWLALAFRLYIGGVFAYASIYKINFPAEFAETIASYQIVPYFAVNFMAVILPWVELISGVLLIIGVRAKAAAIILAALLGLFTLAIVITLLRGVPIGCGCFHTIEDPISWKTLVRDLIWLGMAIHVCLFDRVLRLEGKYRLGIKAVE